MNDKSDTPKIHLDRRTLLGDLALGGALLTSGGEGLAHLVQNPTHHHQADHHLEQAIDTLVVIYAENRSFNNLFADFPGLEQPLSSLAPERYRQLDRNGTPLPHLPLIWGGLIPHQQTLDGHVYHIGEKDLPNLANAPFALSTAEGQPLPHGLVTRDLIHAFYNNQLQINGGRNDGFVAWGDSGALVMGHYADTSTLGLWSLAREFTLCDNFFMGAFGGSFLNHQYLIAACPPTYPRANQSVAQHQIVRFDPAFPEELRPVLAPGTAASALDGPVHFVADRITPDFHIVNTMLPPFMPSYQPDPARPGWSLASSAVTTPAQHHTTLGDLLSAHGVDWAWYAGAWNHALTDLGHNKSFPPHPAFQPHHQPFNYFARFAPGTKARAQHLRDGGLGDSAPDNRFLADVEAGHLPSVTFYKPQGDRNLHAGYADIAAGDRHITKIIEALRASPQWHKMLICITVDENGGWWDHVAPPKGDRWGPGTRIPTLIISPHARKDHVDHTIYDTGSIARFISRRFGLPKLPGLALREAAMIAAGGPPPGDLTRALNL